MAKQTLHLLVHDMNHVLSDQNCKALGLPLGSDYNFFKMVLGNNDGTTKKKNGLDIWILPFWLEDNLLMTNVEGVDEILTVEEYKNYNFDKVIE